MSQNLENLRGKDPKAFWNLLKEGYINNKTGNVNMDDWYQHFSGLLVKNADDVHVEFDPYKAEIEELDKEFTLQELRDAIFYHLKFHKASGPDGIHNGLLKWGMEWLQNSILVLFNQLWTKEIYPPTWNELFLIPVFKSGNLNIPTNYRGIAVMSCLGKLFAIMVNMRIYAWAEKTIKYLSGREVLEENWDVISNVLGSWLRFIHNSQSQKLIKIRSKEEYLHASWILRKLMTLWTISYCGKSLWLLD